MDSKVLLDNFFPFKSKISNSLANEIFSFHHNQIISSNQNYNRERPLTLQGTRDRDF